MRVTDTFDAEFHYCCLKTASGSKLGIAPAAGMRVVPGDRSKNTVLLQLEVDDLHELFAHLRQADTVITLVPLVTSSMVSGSVGLPIRKGIPSGRWTRIVPEQPSLHNAL